MHFEDRRPDKSEERILPLINVVFLLLIFFMIAGSLSSSEPFEVEPPRSAQAAGTELEPLRLVVGFDGNLALEGETLPRAELFARLKQHLKDNPQLKLQLKADGRIPGNRLVLLLEELRAAGVEKLRLLTLPEAS